MSIYIYIKDANQMPDKNRADSLQIILSGLLRILTTPNFDDPLNHLFHVFSASSRCAEIVLQPHAAASTNFLPAGPDPAG